jgi:glutamate-1-semialdehyde 2,1-aminomutase
VLPAREEIMNYLAPLGPVYQAELYQGIYWLYAGLAMLQTLNNDAAILMISEKTAACWNRKVLKANNVVFTINRIGSMISVHFEYP